METVNCNNCGAGNKTNSKYCNICGYELPKTEKIEINTTTQHETVNKNNKYKKILGIAISLIFFAISYYAVQQLFFKASSYDKQMMAVANEINKSCPLMVDAETRLDNAIALPNKIFQYNYTLLKIEKETADTATMKNFLEPNITNNIKTNPQMKFQRDNNWTLNYYYKDKKGVYLFIISITPDKYE